MQNRSGNLLVSNTINNGQAQTANPLVIMGMPWSYAMTSSNPNSSGNRNVVDTWKLRQSTQPVARNPTQNKENKRQTIPNMTTPETAKAWSFKSQRDKLLVEQIVTLKWEAYDNVRWFDRDLDRNRDFHSSCTDFIQIVMLTETKDTVKNKIRQFLCSDLLNPRYVPQEHIFRQRRLNPFHTFWNVMHQLPYYIKTWDQRTKAEMIWFYQVGIRNTLLCQRCQGHYTKWLTEMPVYNAVESRMILNWWLFRLHNDVNRRTQKPEYHWYHYDRRWAPKRKRQINTAALRVGEQVKSNIGANAMAAYPRKGTYQTQPMLSNRNQPSRAGWYHEDARSYPSLPVYQTEQHFLETINEAQFAPFELQVGDNGNESWSFF